jgi:hypothetical protein
MIVGGSQKPGIDGFKSIADLRPGGKADIEVSMFSGASVYPTPDSTFILIGTKRSPSNCIGVPPVNSAYQPG